MCRSIDQHRGKRLTAQIANVDTCFCADFDRIKTRRLAAYCVHSCRNNFDVLLVPKHAAKKPFRDRAAADITCTDKEDVFHNLDSASERNPNLKSNRSKSICALHGMTAPLGLPQPHEGGSRHLRDGQEAVVSGRSIREAIAI
jgi:hypothetical protein